MVRLAAFCLFSLTFLACTGQEKGEQKDNSWSNKESIEFNQVSSKQEIRIIEKYGERRGWKLKNTGSGAHYWIYDSLPGNFPQEGDLLYLNMVVTLLSGDTCYNTANYGMEEVKVGKDQSEAGLHEVLPFIPIGSKAKIVLPSYLAFGVAGDQNKIPPMSTVIYDVQVFDSKQK